MQRDRLAQPSRAPRCTSPDWSCCRRPPVASMHPPAGLVTLSDARYRQEVAGSAAFARASEPADAVAAVRSPQSRPFAAGPGGRLHQAGGWAGAPYVPPSRVPVRAGAADSGLPTNQRMLLRECDCAENPGAPSCEGCEQRQLQRSGDGLRPSRIPAAGPLHPGITSAIDTSYGGGQPLERSARERLELGLGESLGDVRVHTDAHAAALARAVSARAFTVGADLFFAAGAYRPGSRDGDKLIAHEATHAVQQRGGPASGPLSLSAPGDAAELEAEAMASTLQAEASAHPSRESASPVGHEPTRTAAAKQATRGAAISVARTADPTSDEYQYQRGYDDGWARKPATPGPLRPDALDNYNEGYQNGKIDALAEAAGITLPVGTSAGGTPGKLADISIGGGGQGTGVPEGDRETLSPTTDWSKDPAYIDNNVVHTHYDLNVNRFEVEYKDGTSIDLDYDSVRGAAARQPPAPPPPGPASTTPAPAAGVTQPSPPPPSSPPPVHRPPKPAAARPQVPAFGAGGLFFRAKSNDKIYPIVLSKATIPTIYARAEETAQQEPEARERHLEGFISMAAATQAVAGSAIKGSREAAGPPLGQQREELYSLGERRKSGAQFLLRNVDPSEVKASQQGYQVYEYYTGEGECLYVGKSGGAGGMRPSTWVDRGWDHIEKHPEIAEADHIRVTAELTEQEAYALEEHRIAELKPSINVKVKPGEGDYTRLFGAAGLEANAQSASQQPTYTFETDMPPYSPAPVKK